MGSEASEETPPIFQNAFGFPQRNHHFSKRNQYIVDRNQHFGGRNDTNWDPSPFKLRMLLKYITILSIQDILLLQTPCSVSFTLNEALLVENHQISHISSLSYHPSSNSFGFRKLSHVVFSMRQIGLCTWKPINSI